MRRSLVLGDEGARHPFLQSLPPHVRRGGCNNVRMVEQAGSSLTARWAYAAKGRLRAIPSRLRRMKGPSAQDMRDFLLAYCACFVAVMTFIA